ncbi:MAG: hypothetical protein LBN30_07910 [Oscillospiraceae bacterium]|jgi:hypothetical protein|nr:hypothetical protein [Oscillospiraceae bacterium]
MPEITPTPTPYIPTYSPSPTTSQTPPSSMMPPSSPITLLPEHSPAPNVFGDTVVPSDDGAYIELKVRPLGGGLSVQMNTVNKP